MPLEVLDILEEVLSILEEVLHILEEVLHILEYGNNSSKKNNSNRSKAPGLPLRSEIFCLCFEV